MKERRRHRRRLENGELDAGAKATPFQCTRRRDAFSLHSASGRQLAAGAGPRDAPRVSILREITVLFAIETLAKRKNRGTIGASVINITNN